MRANCSGVSPAKSARELRRQDVFGHPRFPLFQPLADADDGSQPGFERGRGLLENRLVGFAEILAALAMADDHPAASGRNQHGRGNFAGIGAFLEPEQVLRADADVGAARGVDRRGEIHERRADYDFGMARSGHQRGEIVQKTSRLGGRFVHLPVAGDHRFAHASRIARFGALTTGGGRGRNRSARSSSGPR